jgi:hypothetical protein
MSQNMTAAASGKVASPVLTKALLYALLAFASLSVLFLVQENGLLLSSEAAHYLHEVTHDARHALGVPCH